MSTKDLARTVIEGGRHPVSKRRRRRSHRTARAHQRGWLATLDDERAVEHRPHAGRSFDDRLAPVLRWLRSRVGRRWDDVHAELRARFDVRTTAGRHLFDDHLRWFTGQLHLGSESLRTRWFVIDGDGILRGAGYPVRRRARSRDDAAWCRGRHLVHTRRRGSWWVRAEPAGVWVAYRQVTETELRRIERLAPPLQRALVLDGGALRLRFRI